MKSCHRFRVTILAAVLFSVCWWGCSGRNHSTPTTPGLTDVAAAQDKKTPPANAGPTYFPDVTHAAGIGYRWDIKGKRPLNILQTIGNGCAFLDYDNDGNLDILLVGPKLRLYKGDGKGHFADVTAVTGLDKLSGNFLGCTVGDYDNDGYDDLYITAYRGGVLLHNEAGKSFKDVTAASGIKPQAWGTSCSFADVDGDGKLDLYICDYVKFGPDTKPQLCEYSGYSSACGPRFYQPEFGVLYHNEGNGKFREVTKAWGAQGPVISGKGLGVAIADYNGSGRQSIALANDEMPGDLLDNTGHKFKNIGATSGTAYDNDGNVHGGMGIDWGDYDNDGKLNLAVATFQHEMKCLYHNENGLFTDNSAMTGLGDKTKPYVAFGIKFLDFDNDGFLDLIIANGHVQDNIDLIDRSTTFKQPIQLFHNAGGTAFEDYSDRGGPAFQRQIMGRGLAIGDFDNDGRMDVLVVDSDGEPILLHNETPNVGHWLSCKLEGRQSNRDGIGALVTAEAGGLKLTRRCAADGSYMSASDRRVHFGLGKATTVDTITVRWPGSKKTDTYRNVPADRIITLIQGESIVH